MDTTPDTAETPNTLEPDSPDARREVDVLQGLIAALQPLSAGARVRILDAAATFMGVRAYGSSPVLRSPGQGAFTSEPHRPSFSADLSMSPKEFMLEKQPRTDVERVACLAYYLTHYRDQPHFKTLDLSTLNTEAAQPKFSNAANSSNNAVKRGYLVPSVKGQRQLSAAGERFVLALPDRDAAKEAMTAVRPRRRNKRSRPTPTPSAET